MGSSLQQSVQNTFPRQRMKNVVLILIGMTLAIAVVPAKCRRYAVIATFCVVAALCFSSPKVRYENFAAPSLVTYDSILELQHNTTLARTQNCFLVSTPATYWKTGSSGGYEINVAADQHWQSMWQIKRAFGYQPGSTDSSIVTDGDVVRLQDIWTGRYLHSQTIPADYITGGFNEVSGFGGFATDDANSNWKISVGGGGQLTSTSTLRLQHVATKNWLHSLNAQTLLYSNQNVASQIVLASPTATVDSVWTIYRAEPSTARAVRMYTDLNNPESAMDTYQVVGKLKEEVVLNTTRDNVSAKYLVGLIVPPGAMVDFYRGPNKATFMTRLTSGKYDNLNLGSIGSTVLRPFCTISLWANCNYTGQSACLQYGYSKIPFFPQSWQISDGVNVTLFNASTSQAIQPSSNSAIMTLAGTSCTGGNRTISRTLNSSTSDQCQQACLVDPTCVATNMTGTLSCNLWTTSGTQSSSVPQPGTPGTTASSCYVKTPSFSNEVACNSSTNPSFSQITEVVAYPLGANVALFRDPTNDPNSQVPFDTAAVASALPTVAPGNLQCYLDGCLPESYAGGRIWKDISGNNRHFVWRTPPRFTTSDAFFKGIDQAGAVAIGPPSNSFGLKDGSQGYTIAMVVASYKAAASNSFTISLPDSTNDPHGISCNVPAPDGNVYFNNSTTSGNLVTVNSSSFNPYKSSVVVVRRTSDNKLSVWIDGMKSAEASPGSASLLTLGKANVNIFSGTTGSARAFVVYNTGLTDADVASLTTFLNTIHRDYKTALAKGTSIYLHQVLPDLKISNGLRCLLDARSPKSASPGSDVWLDLTNNHNDFTWISTPVLKAGRFVNVNMNGTGLTGPPSDSFGITTSYTIFIAAKTNGLSASQSFHLTSDVGLDLTLSNASKDGKMTVNQAGTASGCPTTWQQYSVYTYRWSNTKASGSTLSLFIDGWHQVDATANTKGPVFNGAAAQIGGSPGINLDWQADVGGVAVYDRALADSEIKVMADWMNAPMYGSTVPPTAATTIPNTTKAHGGVCVNQQVGSRYYSKSQCLSPTANVDGGFDTIDPAAGGWCFTDPADNSSRAFCGKRADYSIEAAIDKTSPAMSYTSARQFCEAKGGRLCNADEICDSGPGGRPRVGFETLSKADCASAGGTYDSTNNVCRAPDGTTPYYVPGQESYLPINDYNNAWMTIGTSDPTKMCRSIDDITGSKPSWGSSTTAATGRQNILCCGTGASGLSQCDQLKERLETVAEQLNSKPDAATQVALLNTQSQLQTQYQQTCSFVPYQTAYTAYQNAQTQQLAASAKVDDAQKSVDAQKTAALGLSGVVDSSGKQYLDSESATKAKGIPFADGTFHSFGQISDVKNQMSSVQTQIDTQEARLKACPADPTCPAPKKGVADPVKSSDATCNTQDLVTSLLKQPVLATNPAVGGRLRLALQPRNILKDTDIRTHKDYYKYVDSKNVKSCTSLPKDTGKTPKDFDISNYPGFAGTYVPLQSLDVSSVPPDRLSDYNMLIGSSNSSGA